MSFDSFFFFFYLLNRNCILSARVTRKLLSFLIFLREGSLWERTWPTLAIKARCMDSPALKYLGFLGELAMSICLMCHNAVQYSESPVVNLTLQL